MLYKNISKKFLDYLYQTWLFILSFLVIFIGFSFFLLSDSGKRLFNDPSSNWNIAQLTSLTRAGYWVSPTLVTKHNSKQAFSIDLQEQQWLTDWISKHYPVDTENSELFVSAAYLAAHELELDPHLILAVMAIESSFNPEAESPVGAQGLMQVMTKVHSKLFEPHGGVKAAKDPITNIRVGSAILKKYISRQGSVKKGLKSYVGAAAYSHDFGYGAKVLAKYHRLKLVSKGKFSLPASAKATQKKLVRAQSKKII